MNGRKYSQAIRAFKKGDSSLEGQIFEHARATREYDGLRALAVSSERARKVYYDFLVEDATAWLQRLSEASPDGPLVVDLCCGAGMASLGMRTAGFDVVLGVDIKQPMVTSFAMNHATPYTGALWCGVEDLLVLYELGIRFPKVDVVVTGPPCQDDLPRGRCGWVREEACLLPRGRVKEPALESARLFSPSFIVMETTSTLHSQWAKSQGERQRFSLVDSEYGGYTSRRRLFHIWGSQVIDIPMSLQHDGPGWGEAMTIAGVEWTSSSLMGSESNAKAKRAHHLRSPDEPSPTVVGGGRSLVIADRSIYPEGPRRIQPKEAAALQGFPELQLAGTYRDKNIQVGNGWAHSYGATIGAAIMGLL